MLRLGLRPLLLAASTCVLSATAACFPAMPPIPAGLAAEPAWEIHRAGSVLRPPYEWHFGPYLLRGVQRGAVEDASRLLDGLRGRSHLRQRFEFRLLDEGGGQELDVRCVINDHRSRIVLVLNESRTLVCTMTAAEDTTRTATLHLVQQDNAAPTGHLRHNQSTYQITAELIQVRDVVGYQLMLDDQVVAGARLGRASSKLEWVLGPEPERAAGSVRIAADVATEARWVLAAATLALLYNCMLIDP
jgi:hypothetical protein